MASMVTMVPFSFFSTVARNNTVEVIGSEEADSHGIDLS
jgi:hypothetical protein